MRLMNIDKCTAKLYDAQGKCSLPGEEYISKLRVQKRGLKSDVDEY